ncbi:MAG: gamma-glutamyltransferase [Alphaproteobacteria bacterium]|nr:gamma-glutamyltransferase [Alphaproteobacteria bacterium]
MIERQRGSETWVLAKPAVVSGRGMVASQHRLASEAGAEILGAGGNAVDAAVATALALGVVEPWMSGIGGGGCLIFAPVSGPARMVDFTLCAPRGLDPARYRIVPGRGGDLFDWPRVDGDRNLLGYESIAVPGAVEGFGAALEAFGTMPLSEVIQPALRLARAGLPVDWHLTLMVASEAAALARDPGAAARYLPGGLPPVAPPGPGLSRLSLDSLADTMERIAKAGRRALNEGELARELAEELRRGGSAITAEDLAGVRARIGPATEIEYRGTRIAAAAGLTAGPSLKDALDHLTETFRPAHPAPAGDTVLAHARALHAAYARRLAQFGHDGLAFGADPGTTSHLSVVDGSGNMVALTNTLMSLFGSKVVLPRLGLSMNNGMISFDPRPDHPNGLRPGRRPLSNMCPMVASRDGRPWLALGACGGRKIMPAVLQIASFMIDYGLSLEAAFHLPRIDASTGPVLCDERLDSAWIERLAAEFPVAVVQDGVYPGQFATPSAVAREGAGRFTGMTRVSLPAAAAVAPGA